METIVVTGSSGYIGYPLCDLLSKSYKVVGLDRPGAPHPPASADAIDLDLTSEHSVQEAMRLIHERYGNKIASVVHLAAFYDFSGKPSPMYEEINVRGTERLLHHLKPFQVRQFIYSSTMLVHAPTKPGQPINEKWLLDPKWDYPKSKFRTENLIRRESGKIPVVFARVAGVYDDDCHSIPIAHQIQRIYERSPTSHFYPGDLACGQSFIHLEDTLQLFVNIIERRKNLPSELAVLAGEPETLGYDTLQREFARLIHSETWKTLRIPKVLAKAGAWTQDHMPLAEDPFIKPWMIDLADDHYELDISLARKMLGWTPRHSLKYSLAAMIASLKKDPARWYKENKLHGSAVERSPERVASV